MNRLLLVVAACVLSWSAFAVPAEAARCTGSPSCRACRTCSSCAHCSRGGSCGVCASRQPVQPVERATPAPSPRPAPPAAQRPQPQPRVLNDAILFGNAGTHPSSPLEGAAVSEDGVSVFFSPGGRCTEAIVQQINQAKNSVAVQAYRLTSLPIAEALVDAHKRGVQVTIVLDGRQQSDKYSDATFFHNHGMSVFIDGAHAIAHNKVIIIDRETIITGSFNFSAAAEDSNSENLLIIQGKPQLAQAYVQNFGDHLQHIQVYEAPAAPFQPGSPEGASAEEDGENAAATCCDGAAVASSSGTEDGSIEPANIAVEPMSPGAAALRTNDSMVAQ